MYVQILDIQYMYIHILYIFFLYIFFSTKSVINYFDNKQKAKASIKFNLCIFLFSFYVKIFHIVSIYRHYINIFI